MTLTEFLTARLDEDEADIPQQPTQEWCPECEEWCPECGSTVTRTSAEAVAKRQILAAWQENDEMHNAPGFHYRAQVFEQIIRTIATVYADHPDYQSEWVL
jgi:hypothetical protein